MAQRPVCGLPGGEEDRVLIERLMRNKQAVASSSFQRGGNMRFVPLVVHDIRKVDNTGEITASSIYNLVCNVNQFYADQNTGIQFYLEEINVILNDNAYSSHTGNSGNSILSQNKRSRAINVFIPETANTGSQSLGTVLGYYSIGSDWIVIRPAEVNGSSSTLAHELGHYFSLPHPFRGWDSEAYDPDIHGVQVGPFSPVSSIRNEFQNGSNCDTAGDLICDTPPDYNHFDTNWGCNYAGGAKDPNGDLIDPTETNVMSYFTCNPPAFSDDQIDLMNADLNLRLVTNNFVYRLDLQSLSPGDVPGTVTMLEPINEEVIASNIDIFLDWQDVPNATNYIIELDRFPSFNVLPLRFSVDNSELNFNGDNLFKNRKYYWRVKATSPWDVCAPWSDTETFTTNALSSLNQVEGLESFSIFPNPLRVGTAINLQSRSEISFSGDLEILNINGQVMQSIAGFNIQSGEFNAQIETSSLTAGVYFLRIVSDEGIIQEKFVVQ